MRGGCLGTGPRSTYGLPPRARHCIIWPMTIEQDMASHDAAADIITNYQGVELCEEDANALVEFIHRRTRLGSRRVVLGHRSVIQELKDHHLEMATAG